ncbi:uncharacterized protein FIBRA_05202 [Fibroporia radiculosa]|uniref:RRM domain-containing protein n=1 Tax=Fibroporia radiculosa TaxID=599839 RepID=J4HX46_9APHY|nr:uncharacterized protein FIBRA_05202 [Fibroporia radiculosa]CCM03082.1 predicted protein [Fibroporia radiculosa]
MSQPAPTGSAKTGKRKRAQSTSVLQPATGSATPADEEPAKGKQLIEAQEVGAVGSEKVTKKKEKRRQLKQVEAGEISKLDEPTKSEEPAAPTPAAVVAPGVAQDVTHTKEKKKKRKTMKVSETGIVPEPAATTELVATEEVKSGDIPATKKKRKQKRGEVIETANAEAPVAVTAVISSATGSAPVAPVATPAGEEKRRRKKEKAIEATSVEEPAVVIPQTASITRSAPVATPAGEKKRKREKEKAIEVTSVEEPAVVIAQAASASGDAEVAPGVTPAKEKKRNRKKGKANEITNVEESTVVTTEPNSAAMDAEVVQDTTPAGEKKRKRKKAKVVEVANVEDLAAAHIEDSAAASIESPPIGSEIVDEPVVVAMDTTAVIEESGVSQGDTQTTEKKTRKKQMEEESGEAGAEDEAHLWGFSTDADSSDDDMEEEWTGLDMAKLPTIAKDDAVVKRKLEKAKEVPAEDRGVIYLGRLPHGFYEDQMRSYFSQFGDVTRLRLSRNKKTGRSKHYAFIEFDSSSVARIVAETMDNYLLMGHILTCKVIPKDEIHPELWVGANKKWRVVPRDRVARVQHNKPRTQDEQARAEKRLLHRQIQKKRKLEQAGIKYDFDIVAYKKAKPTEA